MSFRIITLFLIFFSNSIAEEISGIPKVVDGDTVHINDNKFRLEGIDAPEMRQQCKKESLKISSMIGFTLYKNYSCGEVSKEKLISKIRGSKIKCIFTTKDRYKRYIATCYKEKTNLNQWMVRTGYAIASRRYSKKYVRDEEYAKENKLGIWKGTFIAPEKWRKLN